MYTTHGHHIPGTDTKNTPLIQRVCGGPGPCFECSNEAMQIKLQPSSEEPGQSFYHELRALINKHSKENGSMTPDHILASYLERCLQVFDETLQLRTKYYARR